MRRFFIVAFSHITTEHLLHIRDLSLQEPRERRGNGSPHTSCVIVTCCPHSCAYRLFLPCSPYLKHCAVWRSQVLLAAAAFTQGSKGCTARKEPAAGPQG